LLLSLLLTFLLDSLGIWLKYPIYIPDTSYSAIDSNMGNVHSWEALLGTLANVQGWYTSIYGTNGPLWSLAYEWWFYMFYPLLFWIHKRNRWVVFIGLLIIGYLNSVGIVGLGKGNWFLYNYPLWWSGVMLCDIYVRKEVKLLGGIAFLAIFLVCVPLQELRISEFEILEYSLIWFGMIGLVAASISLEGRFSRFFSWEPFHFLGRISYSLYVLHLPLLVLFSGILMSKYGGLLPEKMYWIPVGLVLSVSLGWIGYLLVEKPYPRILKALNL
jgi:peptidoglycan/LPS O-acetylase OafA/YrhL